MKRILIIAIICLTGCSTTDDMTVMILSNRIKSLENALNEKKVEEVKVKTIEAPVVNEEVLIYWVTNINESVSRIKIIKRDGKFIGPRGEEYPSQPTQRQIERMYRVQ